MNELNRLAFAIYIWHTPNMFSPDNDKPGAVDGQTGSQIKWIWPQIKLKTFSIWNGFLVLCGWQVSLGFDFFLRSLSIKWWSTTLFSILHPKTTPSPVVPLYRESSQKKVGAFHFIEGYRSWRPKMDSKSCFSMFFGSCSEVLAGGFRKNPPKRFWCNLCCPKSICNFFYLKWIFGPVWLAGFSGIWLFFEIALYKMVVHDPVLNPSPKNNTFPSSTTL